MRALALSVLLPATCLLLPAAYALDDRSIQVELQRYDLLMGKIQDQNTQLMSQVRELQRQNYDLVKRLDKMQAQTQSTYDQMQKVENVNVRNVESAQKQLNEALNRMDNNTYDWGGKTRDCADLGVKHQQIKVATKPDGSRTVRFLCFDGKAIHLGTEVYAVGAE
ncbi:MAG: hypothetical protein WAZ18_03565 [Alphaproteobacteria bacterium]